MSERSVTFQCLNDPEYDVVFCPGDGVETDVLCCGDDSMSYNFAELDEQYKVDKLLQCLRRDSLQVVIPAKNSQVQTDKTTLDFQWINSEMELAIKTLHPTNDWMEFVITRKQANNLAEQIILSYTRKTPLPTPAFGLDYLSLA